MQALAKAKELKCDTTDPSYCIFNNYDYIGNNNRCYPQGYPNTGDYYSVKTLNNLNNEQLTNWLNTLYDRKNRNTNEYNERPAVVDYVERCRSLPNYSFLNNTKAAPIVTTTQAPIVTTIQAPVSTTTQPSV